MSNNSSDVTKIICLNPGSTISIAEVAEKHGLEASELEFEFRAILDEHYRNFGTKAFALEYAGKSGAIIRSESHIGVLKGRRFTLELKAKIPGLKIAKALSMAQEAGGSLLKVAPSSKVASQISPETDYSPLEVVAFPFLESVESIFRNGIARRFEEVIIDSNRSGTILFQEWANRGLLPPPTKANVETTLDILPNRIIVAALLLCLKSCKSEKIKMLCKMYLEHFDGVSGDLGAFDLDNFQLHNFSLPRFDYERGLFLSRSILTSFDINFGVGNIQIPSITVDLDKVFEDFCSLRIKKHLKESKFEVLLQHELHHPVKPIIPGFIRPDVIVRNRASRKSVVIDLKNKYSAGSQGKALSVSNPDLFQTLYYSKAIGAVSAILVYPATNPPVQFPIRTAESEAKYLTRVERFLDSAKTQTFIFFPASLEKQNLITYQIDLDGTMADTVKSLVSLCLMVERLTT